MQSDFLWCNSHPSVQKTADVEGLLLVGVPYELSDEQKVNRTASTLKFLTQY